MANISSLAAELLNQISQYVYNPEDILSFSLVNKQFFSIMQPTLKQAKAWHRIYISPMDDCSESSISENLDYVDPIRAILRNVIQLSGRHRYWVMHYAENPDVPMAHYENTYRNTRKSALKAYAQDPNALSIIINDGNLFTEAAKNTGLLGVNGLMSNFKNSNPDAHLALLLSICPNLRSVSLVNPYRSGTVETFWGHVAGSRHTMPCFQRMHHVSCHHNYTAINLDFRAFTPLFGLPLMRSINAQMNLNLFPEENIEFTDQAKTSTITDITVTQSGLHEDTVSLVLQWPQALKRFHFEQAGVPSVGEPFNPTKFAKALAFQKESLEVLEIPDLVGDWFCNLVASEVDDPNQFTLGSLQGFGSLRILDVRIDILLGKEYASLTHSGNGQRYRSTHRLVDLLPQSIEELTLHETGHTFDSDVHIRELATHAKVCLPALRSFVLRPNKQYIRTPEKSKFFEEYKVLFARVDVSFVVDGDYMDILGGGM